MTPDKTKILVIDDDEKLLGAVRRLLTAAGFDIITSDSALRLPQLVQREKPDLVLLDIEMPALTGEHVLEMTKLFEFLRETPIVLYTAFLDHATEQRAHAIGLRTVDKGEPHRLMAEVRFVLGQ